MTSNIFQNMADICLDSRVIFFPGIIELFHIAVKELALTSVKILLVDNTSALIFVYTAVKQAQGREKAREKTREKTKEKTSSAGATITRTIWHL